MVDNVTVGSVCAQSPSFMPELDGGKNKTQLIVDDIVSHINQSHHSDAVAVDLRLVNCDLENSNNGSGGKISKVAVTFDSSAKTTGADPILNNTSTGEATGVGVRLMNKDQSNIVLGTATPDIDLAPTSSEQTLNFFAWMEQIDQATPVTPGAVTANATYVLDYK